ncbi:MAG: glycogen-binding domain-containing protein, partial [Elusimicrobiota bacterium]|nr:glycogen-binding domain-containing protein [Elusimicrobiota bacterium]
PTPVPVPAAMKDKPAPLSDEAREFLTMTGSTQITDKKALSREKPPSKKNSKTDKPSVLKETPKKVKALKTIFRYKNLKAKSVSVAGSFTKWNKIKMKKKKGIWQANIWILPGTYLFHYVVDGKKVLDSSLPKADIGESVIDAGN